jgi:hypothetical protein
LTRRRWKKSANLNRINGEAANMAAFSFYRSDRYRRPFCDGSPG